MYCCMRCDGLGVVPGRTLPNGLLELPVCPKCNGRKTASAEEEVIIQRHQKASAVAVSERVKNFCECSKCVGKKYKDECAPHNLGYHFREDGVVIWDTKQITPIPVPTKPPLLGCSECRSTSYKLIVGSKDVIRCHRCDRFTKLVEVLSDAEYQAACRRFLDKIQASGAFVFRF